MVLKIINDRLLWNKEEKTQQQSSTTTSSDNIAVIQEKQLSFVVSHEYLKLENFKNCYVDFKQRIEQEHEVFIGRHFVLLSGGFMKLHGDKILNITKNTSWKTLGSTGEDLVTLDIALRAATLTKDLTLFLLIFNSPNLTGGLTAVIVAILP